MKYVLTSFLSLLMVALLHAQTPTVNPGWNYGVKADVNFSNIRGQGMAGGFTVGGQGGVYVERVFDSRWSVQPELLFTQSNSKKGEPAFTKAYVTAANPFGASDIKLAYISLPVMFKYNINKAFAFLAGPQYSYLIVDAESLLRSGDGKAFKKSEASANVGAQFTAGRVGLYGRYNFGFLNINNIDSRYTWYSNHIQLGISVRIN